MEKIIIKFMHLLREGGMKIALSEGEDALKGLQILGISDKHNVYQILKATLLKDESKKELFDLVWQICFHQQTTFSTTILPNGESHCDGHDGEIGTGGMTDTAKRFYGLLREHSGAEAVTMIEDHLRQETLEELSSEELAEQLKVSLGWFMAAYALKRNEDHEGAFLLNELDRYLKLRCREQKIKHTARPEEILAKENTETLDFSALSESQVKAMELKIAKLGKRLEGRYSYRLKPDKKGIPDMRRVMSEAALQGHLPVHLKYLDKKKDTPSLVVLCDISGSMGIYSSFCLQLVCAMERRFQDIRSFLFIESVVEADFNFKNKTTAEAVAAAMDRAYPKRTGRSKEQCTTTGVSDYGKALEAFRRKFPDCLDQNTTLLILGDARTNWFPPKPEELRDLRSRCAKIYWLNPEPKEQWNHGDSAVRFYLPHCTAMWECRNLQQLERSILRI